MVDINIMLNAAYDAYELQVAKYDRLRKENEELKKEVDRLKQNLVLLRKAEKGSAEVRTGESDGGNVRSPSKKGGVSKKDNN